MDHTEFTSWIWVHHMNKWMWKIQYRSAYTHSCKCAPYVRFYSSWDVHCSGSKRVSQNVQRLSLRSMILWKAFMHELMCEINVQLRKHLSPISDGGNEFNVFNRAKMLFVGEVTFSHWDDRRRICVCTNTSESVWSGILTQLELTYYRRSISKDCTSHFPFDEDVLTQHGLCTQLS